MLVLGMDRLVLTITGRFQQKFGMPVVDATLWRVFAMLAKLTRNLNVPISYCGW
jgi:hypothetical protein